VIKASVLLALSILFDCEVSGDSSCLDFPLKKVADCGTKVLHTYSSLPTVSSLG
jgi:hypothetical protein